MNCIFFIFSHKMWISIETYCSVYTFLQNYETGQISLELLISGIMKTKFIFLVNFQHFNYFILSIMFTDKVTFCLSGCVNLFNFIFWSHSNLHWMYQFETQHSLKINVQPDIIGCIIIRSFFINANVTAAHYF